MTDRGVEMVLARWTWTASGDPLSPRQARDEFGPHVRPWIRPGWFWTAATPASADRIRQHGHRAVGTAVTTWIPPQTAVVPLDEPQPVVG